MDRWKRNVGNLKTFKSMDVRMSSSSHAVLRELFELLEDYAPAWYTEEHHERVVAALGESFIQTTIH